MTDENLFDALDEDEEFEEEERRDDKPLMWPGWTISDEYELDDRSPGTGCIIP